MEYFSPIWTGSPASHLAQLDASEANAFKIIGLPRAEAEAMGLSLRHHRQVGGLSVFDHLLSGLAPTALFVLSPLHPPRILQGYRAPPSTRF